jgi:group I intron endonuclease
MLKNPICGIYGITNKITKRVYVGKSVIVQARWNKHRKLLRLNKHHCSHLQRSWNKHGEESFHFSVLEICSRASLTVAEQRWLDTMTKSRLYNARLTSEGGNGGHDEAFKARQSVRMAGNTIWVGRKHTEEHKAYMAAKQKGNQNGKGVVWSAERKAEMAARRLGNQHAAGHKQSAEHVAKRVAARRLTLSGVGAQC